MKESRTPIEISSLAAERLRQHSVYGKIALERTEGGTYRTTVRTDIYERLMKHRFAGETLSDLLIRLCDFQEGKKGS